ncbi:MAG: Rpn family recombination-promoting nuclease/putative transposase [Isosphaeraceae bacterium]
MSSKPYDSTTKELLELDPQGWLALLLGRKLDQVRIFNADLATVIAEADFVLAVDESVPWLVHLEAQSSYDRDLPLRLQRYNILVYYRHRRPVQSIAVLLRPDADGPALSGLLRQSLPDGTLYHEFHYNVVRVWECPVDQILAGGLGTLPLAPLGKVTENELPAVIQSMRQRLEQEAPKNQAAMLWTATYVLMGLKYPDDLIEGLLQGVENMKESVTYQKILREGRAEGRAEEVKRVLKRQATKKFGKPSPRFESAIDSILDLEKLEQLTERVLDAASWEELIGEPANGSN